MKKAIAVVLLALASMSANASQVWIVIGDSIMSDVPQGNMAQHSLHLLAAENDIVVRNISSPGSSLGSTDKTGFNSERINSAIDLMSGTWGWYNGVIVQAGTNDFGRGISVTETINSLRRILSRVQADGKKALVLDPIYRDGEGVPNAVNDAICPSGQNTLNCYRFYMSYVCQQEFGSICRFAPRGNTVMGAWNNNYESTEVAQNKRLHPNATGHRKIADWIKAEAAAAGYF